MKIIYIIRTFIAALIALLFFTAFSIVALPTLWIVGKASLLAREKAARACAGAALRALMFILGTKPIIIGEENIPDEPCLIVGNHRSFFDVIPFYAIFKHRLGFVGKKEFGKFLPFKIWLLYCGSVFLDRNNPRDAMRTINEAAKDVTNGKFIYIFPEGTRGHEDGLLPFHEGSFKIAEKAKCKILPVANIHTDEAWELHYPYAKPTKLKIVFGKTIDTAGKDKAQLKETYNEVVAQIEKMYRENF